VEVYRKRRTVAERQMTAEAEIQIYRVEIKRQISREVCRGKMQRLRDRRYCNRG
jgi:hypothetical protein